MGRVSCLRSFEFGVLGVWGFVGLGLRLRDLRILESRALELERCRDSGVAGSRWILDVAVFWGCSA